MSKTLRMDTTEGIKDTIHRHEARRMVATPVPYSPYHIRQRRSRLEYCHFWISPIFIFSPWLFSHQPTTMVKRTADTELNKDNWQEVANQAETSNTGVSAVPLDRAPGDVLQTRRIVKAKRPVRTNASSNTAAAGASSSNPFANVSLVSAPAKEGEPKTNADSESKTADISASTTSEPKDAATTEGKDPTEKDPSSSGKEGGETTTSTTSSEPKHIFGSTTSYSGFAQVTGTTGGGFSFGSPPAAAPSFSFGTTTSSSTDAAPPKFDFSAAVASDAERPASPTVSPIVKLPETYTVESGEENEECILEVKCKSYKFDWTTPATKTTNDEATFDGGAAAPTTDDAADTAPRTKSWKETGIGMLRVLRKTEDDSIRVVQRQTSTHHVLVNAVLETVRRRQATQIFDVNGTLALKFNPTNAAEFERLVVQPYFNGEAATTTTSSPTKVDAPPANTPGSAHSEKDGDNATGTEQNEAEAK